MKPEYRFTFAIASLLIVTALILPPWKNSYTGHFSGFYYVFSEADKVDMLELDYARLLITVFGIILITAAANLLLPAPTLSSFVVNIQKIINQALNFNNIKHLIINLVKLVIFILIYWLIFKGLGILMNG